jgi:anti-sigma regulatory factor (Ser/Thr protein kinase)
MADDRRLGGPSGSLDGIQGEGPSILDRAFDSGTLGALRAEVRAYASQAGLPGARAEDVVLAVHELAANAVHHGAGAGRLRIWTLAGALHCQVDDGDPRASRPLTGPHVNGTTPVTSLPNRPGHGLWVVRQVADRTRVLSGARGTRATVTFNLPRRSGRGFTPP